MNATLTFNLDDQEDERRHWQCTKSQDAFLVLWDMHQSLRDVAKYSEDGKAAAEAEQWKNALIEKMAERGISLGDIF